ncbi:MAG: hypothetical protein US15_C0010G0006 [Candidatus Moranbacteria bacterium GW2011_GWF1_36_4]|nr:MAG: hypothetical protein US15_C0010G0006 [Candidatus Moranbacteria bacterium GW2011_GWF1_36_4]HAQ03038.1 hypothetical protein [Candidatus Nomurabacteria bacterium]
MNFKSHFDLIGQHAFLGASKYHWINYDEEKVCDSYLKFLATQKGTRLHEFASECICLGIKLPKGKKALNNYVNDAIGFRMIAEQPLFYSDNSFGTADSISFRENFLRIHDLKTGVSPTSMHQLEVYTALFCLEYNYKPTEIGIELRIYQLDEILVHIPDPEEILRIMNKIIVFDKAIEKIKSEE